MRRRDWGVVRRWAHRVARRDGIIASLLLALAVLIFYWPITLAGHWMPSGGGDLVSFLWPTYRFAARSLRQGVIPLWNPYLYSGVPFVADNQAGLFYPVNLALFLLLGDPSYRMMEALVMAHVWWAGLGFYRLARPEGGRWGALVGAVAFAFSDLFIVHFGNLNLVAVAAWLPWLFLGLRRALPWGRPWRERISAALSSGLVLGLATLAGHAQMSLYLALAAGLYALYMAGERLRHRDGREALAVLALLAATGLVGAGVAAVALLPTLEMLTFTGRAALPYEEAARYALPWPALTGFLAPGLFGRGPARFWGPWDRVETGYLGVLPLLLALWGAMPDWRPGRRRPSPSLTSLPTGFLLLLLSLALLLGLGPHTPVHRWAYDLLPGFRSVRAPARLVLLADFALALLAVRGLGRLLSPLSRRERRRLTSWLIGAGGLGVVGLLLLARTYQAVVAARPETRTPDHLMGAWWAGMTFALLWGAGMELLILRRQGLLSPRRLGPIALILTFTDLTILGSAVDVEVNDPTVGFQHPAVVAFLRQDPALFRIEGDAGAWQPDAALVHGLYDIGGVYNPLELGHYSAYRWSVGYRGSPQYNFLGVKYVLADKGRPPGDATFIPVFDEDPQIDVYLNTRALPRALLVRRAIVVPDGDAAFAAIHAPGFDPATMVVVERGPPLSPPAGEEERGPPPTISFLRYGLNDLALEVVTPTPAYLVLAEVDYPGWRAWVDGRPAPIWRANYAFRAVYLEAGQHQVEMRFQPASWRWGMLLTGLTLIGLVGWRLCSVRCLPFTWNGL